MKTVSWLASVVLALAIAGIAPSTSFAAIRPTTFWLYTRDSCVQGTTSSRVSVALKWRRSDGTVLATATYVTVADGYFSVCSPRAQRLRAYDVVRATVNGIRHRLVIPALRLKMDTANDVLYGRAPAGSVLRLSWNYGPEIPVVVRSDGRWSYAPLGVDIVVGTYAYARWKSRSGDTVTFNNIAR